MIVDRLSRILYRLPVMILIHGIFAVIVGGILRPMVDRSMGTLLRWIAVHAALTQTALFLLALLSLTALCSWFFMKARLLSLLKLSMVYTTLIYSLNYLLMLYVTRISWGGIDWQEPRMLVSTQLLFILLPWLGLNLLINYSWLIRYSSLALGFFAQFLIRSAPVVNHPLDPVRAGGEAYLAVGFPALALLFTVLAVYDLAALDRHYNGGYHG